MNDKRRNPIAVSTIDGMYLRVAKTRTFERVQPLTNATGFFYLHDDLLYLVASRHVVINEAPLVLSSYVIALNLALSLPAVNSF